MSTKYRLNIPLALISSALLISAPAAAQVTNMAEVPTDGEWLTGDEILKEYTDTVQTGMYSWTRDNNGIPVSFSEIHHANTITEYSEFGREDFTIRGVWVVKKNVICYYYDDYRINPVNCFTVLKSGNCYYHYDDEKAQDFKDMEDWNSVGFNEDETPTCVPPIS